MYFCSNDGMPFCSKCCLRLGLADPTPRCPRCYKQLRPMSNDALELELVASSSEDQ